MSKVKNRAYNNLNLIFVKFKKKLNINVKIMEHVQYKLLLNNILYKQIMFYGHRDLKFLKQVKMGLSVGKQLRSVNIL